MQPLTPSSVITDHSDEQQCLNYLNVLALTDPERVQMQLLELVNGMLDKPPAPAAYLRILEAMRPKLDFAQGELASHYSMRPLLPVGKGDMSFHRVVTLWHRVAQSYADVARLGAYDQNMAEHLALVCQRCVYFSGQVILEYFRARRQVSRTAWSVLHGYFATTEELGLAAVNVAPDIPKHPHFETALDAYCRVLLVALAEPYCRSSREFAWILRWTQRYARLVNLAPVDEEQKPLYVVDFVCTFGPLPGSRNSDNFTQRQIITDRLKNTLRLTLARLHQGATPATLGLGKDCTSSDAQRVLSLLLRIWCVQPRNRRFVRRAAQGQLEVTAQFNLIYTQLMGERALQASFRTRADAETRPNEGDEDEEFDQTPKPQHWDLVNESVNGFRLHRHKPYPDVSYGDLLGLHPPNAKNFMLARICWLMFADDGTLMIGVNIMGGIPRPVLVKPEHSTEEHWSAAFLLPGVTALHEEISLVIPRKLYQAGLHLDVHSGRPFVAELGVVLHQGNDFIRAAFSQVSRNDGKTEASTPT